MYRYRQLVRKTYRSYFGRLPRFAVIAGAVLGVGVFGLLLHRQLALAPGRQPDETAQQSKQSQAALNPLQNARLFVDPTASAAVQAQAWRTSQPDKAAALDHLAALPTAKWLTSTNSLLALDAYLDAATAAHTVPVLVAYNLPLRDCGRYSAGGAGSEDGYRTWIGQLAGKLKQRQVVVVLEPDALASMENTNSKAQACLSTTQRSMYFRMLHDAVVTLKANKNVVVYVDAGNSKWVRDTAKIASRLTRAGIAQADGFSLNVSNFQTTDDTLDYGRRIAERLDGAHFIVDTSRNGLGAYTNAVYSEYGWCNPPGRALGHFPTTNTQQPLVDAYLYIKSPGESDGQDPDVNKCFGGPRAGDWWPEYALGLIQRWPAHLRPSQQ